MYVSDQPTFVGQFDANAHTSSNFSSSSSSSSSSSASHVHLPCSIWCCFPLPRPMLNALNQHRALHRQQPREQRRAQPQPQAPAYLSPSSSSSSSSSSFFFTLFSVCTFDAGQEHNHAILSQTQTQAQVQAQAQAQIQQQCQCQCQCQEERLHQHQHQQHHHHHHHHQKLNQDHDQIMLRQIRLNSYLSWCSSNWFARLFASMLLSLLSCLSFFTSLFIIFKVFTFIMITIISMTTTTTTKGEEQHNPTSALTTFIDFALFFLSYSANIFIIAKTFTPRDVVGGVVRALLSFFRSCCCLGTSVNFAHRISIILFIIFSPILTLANSYTITKIFRIRLTDLETMSDLDEDALFIIFSLTVHALAITASYTINQHFVLQPKHKKSSRLRNVNTVVRSLLRVSIVNSLGISVLCAVIYSLLSDVMRPYLLFLFRPFYLYSSSQNYYDYSQINNTCATLNAICKTVFILFVARFSWLLSLNIVRALFSEHVPFCLPYLVYGLSDTDPDSMSKFHALNHTLSFLKTVMRSPTTAYTLNELRQNVRPHDVRALDTLTHLEALFAPMHDDTSAIDESRSHSHSKYAKSRSLLHRQSINSNAPMQTSLATLVMTDMLSTIHEFAVTLTAYTLLEKRDGVRDRDREIERDHVDLHSSKQQHHKHHQLNHREFVQEVERIYVQHALITRSKTEELKAAVKIIFKFWGALWQQYIIGAVPQHVQHTNNPIYSNSSSSFSSTLSSSASSPLSSSSPSSSSSFALSAVLSSDHHTLSSVSRPLPSSFSSQPLFRLSSFFFLDPSWLFLRFRCSSLILSLRVLTSLTIVALRHDVAGLYLDHDHTSMPSSSSSMSMSTSTSLSLSLSMMNVTSILTGVARLSQAAAEAGEVMTEKLLRVKRQEHIQHMKDTDIKKLQDGVTASKLIEDECLVSLVDLVSSLCVYEDVFSICVNYVPQPYRDHIFKIQKIQKSL